MTNIYYSILCEIYVNCNAALRDCAMPNNCLQCKYTTLCADIRRFRDTVKGALDNDDNENM